MPLSRIALALVALATLLFEVTLTRLLSFTLWYHFAFLIVGVAMLGSASAASWLATRNRKRAVTRLDLWALGLAAAFVLAVALFGAVPFEPFALAHDPAQWPLALITLSALAAPFFCTGVLVATLLQRAGSRPFSIYAADMLGAGLGAALSPWLVGWLGALGAVLLAAAIAALGAVLLARQLGSRRAWIAGLSLAALCGGLSPWAEQVLPWRVTSAKKIGRSPVEPILRDPALRVGGGWSLGSRVDVIATRGGARILIDAGTAVTRVPAIPASLENLRPIDDVSGLALAAARDGRALIIGSGGGYEVLTALSQGVARVDAVEVNPRVVQWVQADQRFGAARLHADPRVHLHLDEARAFIARHPAHYQAILMVHTISNAALGAGAMSLAEDYVLTREAMCALLAQLSERGRMLLTRPDAQLARLAHTVQACLPAPQTLDQRAVAFRDPRAGGFFAGLIVNGAPLNDDQRLRYKQRLRALGLQTTQPSRLVPDDPRALLQPATDDRPYFSQRVPFSSLRFSDLRGVLGGAAADGRMALEQQPVAEIAALAMAGLASLIGLLGVILPLLLARRTRRALAQTPQVTLLRFAALGVAFMLTEIALMQKLTRLLGHPALAFALSLAAILVGSGLASQLLAPRLARRSQGLRRALWVSAAAVGLLAVCTDPMIDALTAQPLPLRAAAALALAFAAGLALGLPFPCALRSSALQRDSVTWAVAINGFASIAAPALAIMLGAELGLRATLLVGSLLYLVAGLPRDAANADRVSQPTSHSPGEAHV